MSEFTPEFFEGVKKSITQGKIEYLNLAGVMPEVLEERHVVFKLPTEKLHMNHVGIVYAGSYLILAESAGASLIKCTYGSRYVAIIKSVELDYLKPCKGDLVVDISMTQEEAAERIAYVEEHGKCRYPLKVPVLNEAGEVCAEAGIVYYLMKNA